MADRVHDILDLKGRIALVTGAGQGVGRQIAIHLASHNAGGIVINDFYAERAEAVANEVRELGVKALAWQGDVGDFDGVGAMVAAGTSEFGSIDILVNNAGNMGPDPTIPRPVFIESTPEQWHRWLSVNLFGVLNCTRHVLPGMVQNHSGSIITIISDSARYGDANMEVYASAKAAAAALMRSVARTNGRNGIRANAVAIAATFTPASAQNLSVGGRSVVGLQDEEKVKKMMRLYPVGRLGEPNDAANMVLFLASDAASWITGQTYPVNGGFTFSL